MSSDVTLRLLLTGVDKSASKSLKGVGGEAGKTNSKLDKLKTGGKIAGAALAAGLVTAGLAAIDFGKDSLAAFADADKSQKQLEDAYKRFPAVASVNIESLRKLNQAIQRKTGADADDIAAGQAVLARYKLTGQQMKQMTPLLVDYATRTGKDIPAAAGTLGKALMGSARATKELGVNVKLGKDPVKNYAKIMDALKGSVGGYAESVPEAEKKQKILQASFGDLQEAVGEKLQPAMLKLVDAGQGVLDWLDQNPAVAEAASAAFDLFCDALAGIWDIVATYVAPALAWLVRSQAETARGFANLLDALGQIPGFEWAKDAATKVRGIATGMDAVAAGLDALKNKPKPTVDVKDAASEKVAKIDRQIKKLKDKRVKAEAKGDSKEVKALDKEIRKLKGKRVTITTDLKKGKGVVYSGKVSIDGTGQGKLALRAGGGRVRRGVTYGVGEREPELFTSDLEGWILNGAQQARGALLASGLNRTAAAVAAGDSYQFVFNGLLTEAEAGRVYEKALMKLRSDRGRKPLGFMR